MIIFIRSQGTSNNEKINYYTEIKKIKKCTHYYAQLISVNKHTNVFYLARANETNDIAHLHVWQKKAIIKIMCIVSNVY